MDQTFVSSGFEPLFKYNYWRYRKSEFLLDADIQFSQLKKLLEHSPGTLKEDPIIGAEYEVIIQLVKWKKILEYTGNEYAPDSAHYYYDDKDREERKKAGLRVMKSKVEERMEEMPDSLGVEDESYTKSFDLEKHSDK